MPNTYFFRQKYTHWFTQNIGVSLSNMRSNQTFDIPFENYQTLNTENIAKLRQTNNRYLDLSFATKFSFKNHEFRFSGGLSANKRYQMQVSEKQYFADLQQTVLTKYNAAEVKVENSMLPQLSIGYTYKFSPRWSVGVNAQKYFGKYPATNMGLSVNYHFNISADSLGFNENKNEKITYGILGGIGFSGSFSQRNIQKRFIFPYFGFFAEKRLGLTWKTRIELYYAQRGVNYTYKVVGNTTYLPTKFQSNFIQIPILFKNEFAYKWNYFFGPQFSTFFGGKYSLNNEKQEIRNQGSLTLGSTLGIGYDISPKLSLETRFAFDIISFGSSINATGFGINDFRFGLSRKF
jgi:Outer membrane protein beta-barrel domain